MNDGGSMQVRDICTAAALLLASREAARLIFSGHNQRYSQLHFHGVDYEATRGDGNALGQDSAYGRKCEVPLTTIKQGDRSEDCRMLR